MTVMFLSVTVLPVCDSKKSIATAGLDDTGFAHARYWGAERVAAAVDRDAVRNGQSFRDGDIAA
jgi:hypothetical protein